MDSLPTEHWTADIERILDAEGMFVSTTAGVSMKPMLRDRRDTIIIRPVRSVYADSRLRRYDIPLYRRVGDGAYVLHRVIGIRKTEAGPVYVIRGDNTYAREYIRPEQIIGVLTGCFRGDKRIDLDGMAYRVYVHTWNLLYPLRRGCHIICGILARTPLKALYQAMKR